MRLGAVAGQCALERRQHRAAMRLVAHVDEIDDDDAAEIAQPQLARDATAASRLVRKMVSSRLR